MAFILAAIFGVPTLYYGLNEASNAVHDVVNFDYSKYFENKISNLNKKVQIELLELEYKNAKLSYDNYNNEYKQMFISNKFHDKENINEIKQQREHYYNLMKESKERIKKLNEKIII